MKKYKIIPSELKILKLYLLKDKSYAAFTLSGFDDKERNLTFVKTDFQVLIVKFLACNFKQTIYPLHKLLYYRTYIA